MTPLSKIRNPIFCALDTSDLGQATSWAAKLADAVGGVKLGLEFFNARGAKGITDVTRACELPLFLDLKFHDIPNTVAGAVKAVAPLKPAVMTIHAVGGRAMMEAAAKAAREAAEEYLVDRPLLMGVTVLTSMSDEDLSETGVAGTTLDQVRRLAELSKMAGLDGVICSPHEAATLRQDLGPNFKLITPGVRPVWAAANDQKRIMTPAEALAAGADYVVIGRPITAAPDQAAAAKRIVMELAA
ncbi:MAG: orotidine-5'-phosphate decarboxylase [Rhodospirillaceae bacterium]|nr:orotidine-5'-phosphate decarboxylase [Rhodospirillaceae bacterium]